MSTRRTGGVVLTAVLIVAAVAAVGGFVLISGLNSATTDQASAAVVPSSADPTPVPAAYLPPTGSTSAPPSITVPSIPRAADSAPAELSVPSADLLPTTGPGVTEPGILLIAIPAADGSFDVVERVRPATAIDVLSLRPAPVAQAGRQFGSASGDATEVQVSAGDQPLVVPDARVDGTVSLPVPRVAQFDLRYRLTDVSVRSVPSTAGRALAALGPLTGNGGGDLTVRFIVPGDSVLGLNCPLLPYEQQACGTRTATGAGVESELPAALALTTVQFDLPAA